MDLTQYVILGLLIAGVVELIKRLRGKDYWAALTVASAAVIGGLVGFTDYYPDLDTLEGVVAGFAAVGAITTVSAVGNKSPVIERSAVKK